jgi:cellulose synthase/poly-beta-1,6-N-acetylglucosamine synthase-like glycosyltransferase
MDVLALSALALIAYTYLGYPLVAAALARFFQTEQPSSAPYLPSVSVCVAVHNGAEHVAQKVESLLELDYPAERIEFLLYSDGSTDETEAVIREFAARDPRIILLSGAERKGKPSALNALRAAARGEVLVMTDIRQPFARGTVKALVAPLGNPEVGCVSGNLVLKGMTGAGTYWRYEKFIRMSEARLGKMVGVTGTVYAIRRADFPSLPAAVILDDVWVPMQVALARKRITFVAAAEAYDEAFDDDREFGRKVRTLAGNYQLFSLNPRLLSPLANPAWFQVVSHKLLRLVCPWALAMLFVGSFAAAFGGGDLDPNERLFWRALAIGQCVFYALALLGARAGRLAGLARTFVLLNAAAVLGLWRYARGAQRVTW